MVLGINVCDSPRLMSNDDLGIVHIHGAIQIERASGLNWFNIDSL